MSPLQSARSRSISGRNFALACCFSRQWRKARRDRIALRPAADSRPQSVIIRPSPLFLDSSCQLSRDTTEHSGDAGADGGSRSDDHDRDKSGNQTIFNGCYAGLVSDETAEDDFHRTDPLAGTLADCKRRLLERHLRMTLRSSCQLSRDTSEHTGEAGADGGSRGDDHDRDKRGDQTIFNGGDARLVSEETREQDFHRIGSFVGAATFRWHHSSIPPERQHSETVG